MHSNRFGRIFHKRQDKRYLNVKNEQVHFVLLSDCVIFTEDKELLYICLNDRIKLRLCQSAYASHINRRLCSMVASEKMGFTECLHCLPKNDSNKLFIHSCELFLSAIEDKTAHYSEYTTNYKVCNHFAP